MELAMAEERYTDQKIREYASPPGFAHELSSEYGGQSQPEDPWSEVLRWRKAERQRLIEERLAIDASERKMRSDPIASRLDLAIGKVNGSIVSSYWPFHGEPDLRNWAIKIIERGGRIVLPVVIREGGPLEFRVWGPGDPLERGVWNILVPSRGPPVVPDVVIAPVVGFDGGNCRLDYGGGFFDRTLAAIHGQPLAIGVGYAGSRLRTIHPQPHDIPMDVIVTDD
jgi:5,10-methenyltetrahydrofolate synthetase